MASISVGTDDVFVSPVLEHWFEHSSVVRPDHRGLRSLLLFCVNENVATFSNLE